MSKLLDEQSIVDLAYRLRSSSVTLFLQFQVICFIMIYLFIYFLILIGKKCLQVKGFYL